MRQLIFLPLLAFSFLTCAQAQTRSAALPITTEKAFLGQDAYMYDGKRANVFKLNSVLKQDREAHKLNRKANWFLYVAMPGAFFGGLLMGAAGSDVPYGGDYRYDWLSTGTVLLTTSLLLAVRSDKLRRDAVDVYNSNMGFSYRKDQQLNLGFSINQHGVGLSLGF